jgi:apolipoprotein N-acyltransferase
MTRIKQPIDTFRLIFAGLSGLLLTASFPVIGFDVVAWFALVPLMIALRNLSGFDSFRLGFLSGIIHYVTLMYWFIPFLTTYGPFPVIISVGILLLLSAYLSVYVALFSMIISWVRISICLLFLVIPALWVSLEYIRAILFSGFPWELLGHTQYNALRIIQISDIVGVYGVSFLILLSNGLLFILYQYVAKQNRHGQKTSPKHIAVCALFLGGVFGAVWYYGGWQTRVIEDRISQAPLKKIAILQGNIDQTKKWDRAYQLSTIEKYIALSKIASAKRPDLIVLPETAMPFYFSNNVLLTRMVVRRIQSSAVDTLLGSPAYSRDGDRVEYFNRVFLVRSHGAIADEYSKAHLVPFGEYVPLKRWLPFLGKMVEHVGDFSTGTVGDTITWGEHKIGMLICYEMIFPYLSRAAVQNGAHLLINVTNDAWYGKTSAPFQHFSMAVFRAVETRRALVRSANTGISGFIDPLGRVISQTAIFEDAVIGEDIPLMSGQTPYVKLGDFFAQFCTIACMMIILLESLRRINMIRNLTSGGNKHVTRNKTGP